MRSGHHRGKRVGLCRGGALARPGFGLSPMTIDKTKRKQEGQTKVPLLHNPAAEASARRLGHALQAKGDLEGAIAEYRTAIRLQPKYPEAQAALEEAVKAKGKA